MKEYPNFGGYPGFVKKSSSDATLTETDNLSLWLKADEGYGSDWEDQSENSNDATLSGTSSVAGELNGLPAIRFLRSGGDYASITDDATLQSTVGYTIFAVMKMHDQSNLQAILRNKPLGSAQGTSGFSISLSSNTYNTNTIISDNTGTRAWGYSSGGSALPTDYFVACWVLPANKDNSRFIHNNTELSITTTSYGTNGSPLTGTVNGTDLHIAS